MNDLGAVIEAELARRGRRALSVETVAQYRVAAATLRHLRRAHAAGARADHPDPARAVHGRRSRASRRSGCGPCRYPRPVLALQRYQSHPGGARHGGICPGLNQNAPVVCAGGSDRGPPLRRSHRRAAAPVIRRVLLSSCCRASWIRWTCGSSSPTTPQSARVRPQVSACLRLPWGAPVLSVEPDALPEPLSRLRFPGGGPGP